MKMQMLSSREAAAMISVQPQTLRLYRHKGIGPKYIRLGGPHGRVIYDPVDLETWLKERRYSSTSEEAALQARRKSAES